MIKGTHSTPMMGNRSFVSLFTKSFPSTTTGVTAEAVAASATKVVRSVDVCFKISSWFFYIGVWAHTEGIVILVKDRIDRYRQQRPGACK